MPAPLPRGQVGGVHALSAPLVDEHPKATRRRYRGPTSGEVEGAAVEEGRAAVVGGRDADVGAVHPCHAVVWRVGTTLRVEHPPASVGPLLDEHGIGRAVVNRISEQGCGHGVPFRLVLLKADAGSAAS